MKLAKINMNYKYNIFQVDSNELKRHYWSSTKFQVGDLQFQNCSTNPLQF